MKLDKALTKAVILKAKILPRAIELRFTGVMSKVAMVPLSFSPAIDSVAIPIQPLNNRITIKKGSSIVTN